MRQMWTGQCLGEFLFSKAHYVQPFPRVVGPFAHYTFLVLGTTILTFVRVLKMCQVSRSSVEEPDEAAQPVDEALQSSVEEPDEAAQPVDEALQSSADEPAQKPAQSDGAEVD
jgi:hypothetical protein